MFELVVSLKLDYYYYYYKIILSIDFINEISTQSYLEAEVVHYFGNIFKNLGVTNIED